MDTKQEIKKSPVIMILNVFKFYAVNIIQFYKLSITDITVLA